MKWKKIISFLLAGVIGSMMSATFPVSAESVQGDANHDGIFSTVDVILFQKWILAVPGVKLLDWKAVDFNQDGKLNIFDFCLMKRELLNQKTVSVSEGKLYRQTSIIDPNVRIPVFQTFLPEGWTAEISSDWNNYSLAYPGVELVELTSPDGKAQIRIQSPRNFLQDLLWGKSGKNLEEYATFSNYVSAYDYVQGAVQSGYPDAVLVKEFENNPELLAIQQEWTKKQIEFDYQTITGYGYQFTLEDYNSTICRQQYKADDFCMELSCAVNGYQYAKSYIISTPGERRIVWWIPYTVAYYAVDQEAFDKYYSDYEVIVGNSYFTKEFFSLCEKTGKQIEYLMLLGKTESINEWLGIYVDDGVYSTDSQSSQDRIFQEWDDYIKDENSYILEDGSELRVPASIDAVARNEDSFYFGTLADVPSGYDILTK